jgi:DNA ligase 1
MATPTKRRKTNGFETSHQTVGSLDFFFGKQKEEKVLKARNENGLHDELNHTPGLTLGNPTDNTTAQTLADEKLARKVQSEWCTEISSHDEVEESKVKASLPIKDSGQPTWNPIVTKQQFSTSLGPKKAGRPTEELDADFARTVPETLSLQSASSSKDLISSSIPFDVSPLIFDTSLYLPDLKRYWVTEGGNASYGLITRCFVLVNATQSRIKIVDTLVNFLRTIIEGDPGSLLPAVSIP